MNADFQDFKYKELTEEIIKAFYKVYNQLGYGFLEKVYENAMMIEFRKKEVRTQINADYQDFKYKELAEKKYLRYLRESASYFLLNL